AFARDRFPLALSPSGSPGYDPGPFLETPVRPSGTNPVPRAAHEGPTSAAVRGRLVTGPSETWSHPESRRAPRAWPSISAVTARNSPSAAPRTGLPAFGRQRPSPDRSSPRSTRRTPACPGPGVEVEAMFPAHWKPAPSVPLSSTPRSDPEKTLFATVT